MFLHILTQYSDTVLWSKIRSQPHCMYHCIHLCISVIVYLKILACSFASRVTLNTLDTRFYKLTYQQLKKEIHFFSQQLIWFQIPVDLKVSPTHKGLRFSLQFTWIESFQKSVQTCKALVVLFFKLRVLLMFSGWAHLCKMQNLVCPAVSHAVVKCAEARDKYDCK